jgi:polysaccharide biosynthesis protein VpsQ
MSLFPDPPLRWQQVFWALMACCYGGFFLMTLRFAYLGALPTWLQAIPYFDKLGHMVLYAIATYLGHRLLRGKHWRIQGRSLPLFPLAFASFTIVEELLQGFSPNRSLDGIDLICSLLGCWLGYRLAERGLDKSQSKALP